MRSVFSCLLLFAVVTVLMPPALAQTGSIYANPNPCIIPSGQTECTTTITWSSQGTSAVEIWVSWPNGGSPSLFASSWSGGSHTQDASWIQANGTYVFTLYDYSGGSQGANLGSVSVTGVGPVPSFNSGVPESDLESVPSLSNGSTCTDITGAWDENTFPPASWILSQSGTQVSGTVQASDASCGTVTWQVAGSLTDPSKRNVYAERHKSATVCLSRKPVPVGN
jgi:hypothetical protein